MNRQVQIRNGVFETNSSSMHSIAIRKNHGKVTQEQVDRVWLHDGVKSVYSDDLDFGRYPFKILSSMMDKAYYVIASKLGGYRLVPVGDAHAEEVLEEIYSIIRKYRPDFKKFRFNHDWTNPYIDPKNPDVGYLHSDPEVKYIGKDSDDDTGYALLNEDGTYTRLVVDTEHDIEVVEYGSIDHQSLGLLDGFLKDSGVSLEDFLTDNAYVVIIDGDEYMDFDRYVECGIIHADDFEKVYTACDYGWSDDVHDVLNIQGVSCDCD